MNISILVPESSVLQSIADPQYLFSATNNFLLQNGKDPLFKVELVGLKRKITLNDGMYSVNTTKRLIEVEKTDLIIIPALFGNLEEALTKNSRMIPWIKDQYSKGAEVASLCVGAFLLASTGLLNGKKCSTHWNFENELRMMFPEVNLKVGSIITDENGIYSSGGANSYWNLLLHLVEKYTDRQTAILASKYFAIDIDRESQSAFSIFEGQKRHNDELILNVQEYIENNIHEKISIDRLAKIVMLGRRSFERRFKLATNNSVLVYINRVKVEYAKRKLETSNLNIKEVMQEVGYTDTKSFRLIFKKITGLVPSKYQMKYNKVFI